ncbi:shikimate dehydrogenase [Alicyclobacillus ferrooxydans]|uniref:Shikimate dehydrogenase (NADP(+)) n=1 Tax=Alicyclobacillus ferrooxydans TaxID=471514 RepID=A0A0P9CQK3_9BACL|nr:shikimate dehydrogenase [Alicyclobacillus ferrooxydans]KPV38978.1 hypothetical protein AN477_23460 [Alicyclobacillus ferrooxydans]
MQHIYGLIGYPVGHSLSPVMMNRAFDASGMDARYVAFAVHPKDLGAALDGLHALGIRGVNVTIPHKETVYARLSTVTDEARMAKAVNTLTLGSDGLWTGHNTDVEGWWSSFDAQSRPTALSRVSLLGAGGAARAVLTGLAVHARGARVTIASRRTEQSEALAAEFESMLTVGTVPWEERHDVVESADHVIQTTPVGMWPNSEASCLDDVTCLHKGQVVQDLVYRPLRTSLLQQAAARGAHTIDGAQMLIGQGARAFELWTGLAAPTAQMRKAVLERLL